MRMDPIQSTIQKLHSLRDEDDQLIRKITNLAEEHGDTVYKTLLLSLANLDLAPGQARTYWLEALNHKQELGKRLGRGVSLVVALADYLFHNHHDRFSPCLVDTKIFEQVKEESVKDRLTGLNNRAFFDQVFNQQLNLAKRYNTDLSLLFLDIDNFKEINDRFGHQAGDFVLCKIAAIINSRKRESDIAIRYGGEEFILLMPHTGSINGFILAERIREAVSTSTIRYNKEVISLTISGGLASYPIDGDTVESILKNADRAVYISKGAGKNMISLFKKDKRRYLRIKFNSPVQVKELDIQSTKTHKGQCKDICIGGVLFENKEPLPIGATIQIHLAVGNNNDLIIIGKVIRVEAFNSNHYDIGVEISFNEMEKMAREEIAGLIKASQ